MVNTVASVECGALPDDAELARVEGVEAINALARWTVSFVTNHASLDLDAVVGARATLRFRDEREGSTRAIELLVTGASYEGEAHDLHRFSLTLSQQPWLLTLRSTYRIFTDKTTQAIVQDVLRDAGISDDATKWRLSTSYLARLQTVQHGESDWTFIERLLAEEGISYWFDHDENGRSTLVFGDSAQAHDGILAPDVLQFSDTHGTVAPASLFELEVAEEMVPERVSLRDFDVRQPDLYIEGATGDPSP